MTPYCKRYTDWEYEQNAKRRAKKFRSSQRYEGSSRETSTEFSVIGTDIDTELEEITQSYQDIITLKTL